MSLLSTLQQKKPDISNITIQTIYEQYKKGQLDLDVEYQRDVVWNKDKMCGLIDSLTTGYYIPPLIFNLKAGKYRCIDGKQRITSILKFMED